MSRASRAREKDFEKDVFRNYRKKIAKFVKDLPIDEKRIVQEAAISADKTSIAEEINRLKTHSQRLKRLLQDKSSATIGREADFLSQEMQRETHTIAAKTGCLDIHQQILADPPRDRKDPAAGAEYRIGRRPCATSSSSRALRAAASRP